MKKRYLLVCLLLVACAPQQPTITDLSNDVYTTLTGSAPSAGENVNLTGDILTDVSVTTTAYKVITNDSGVKEIDSEKGSYTSIDVAAGERYLVSTSGKELGISTIIFANGTTIVEEKLAKSEILNSFQVVVPTGANKLYVNCNNTKAIKVQKITKGNVSINQNAVLPSSLKVGTTNCGTFTLKSESKTKDEYKAAWEQLFADNLTTLYGFQEYKDKFSSSIKAIDVIGKNNYFTQVTGLANNLVTATAVAPETTAMIACSDTFEGATKSSIKYFVLRSTFHVGTKELAYYNVHFCSDSHLGTEIYKDGISYSAYLRKIQYQQILQDATYYDEAIFAGDFNAATADEFSVFTSANCTLSNGGAFGTYQTHGGSTTDNIIVTAGLKIDAVSVLTDYVLNTDHNPIISNISIK